MAPLSVIGTFLLLMERASAEEACESRIGNLDDFTEGNISSVPLPSPHHEYRLHILFDNYSAGSGTECKITLKDSANVNHTLSPCSDAVCRHGWFLDQVAENNYSLNYVAANSTMPKDGLYKLETDKGKHTNTLQSEIIGKRSHFL